MKSHHRSHIEVPCDFGRASKRSRATSKPSGPAFISPTHRVGRSPPRSTSSSLTNGHSPPVYLTQSLVRSLPPTFLSPPRLYPTFARSVAHSHLSLSLSLPRLYLALARSVAPSVGNKKNLSLCSYHSNHTLLHIDHSFRSLLNKHITPCQIFLLQHPK